MTATERVLDGWSVDVERRARHYAAVIAAAHRLAAAEVLADTDPTPPHGIPRPSDHRKEPHMDHTDETPPVGYRPPSVADGTVSQGLIDGIRDLFDRYGPAGVESAVIEMRQMLADAVEVAALTVVLGDAPASTELVTTAGAEALARYLVDHGVRVMRP